MVTFVLIHGGGDVGWYWHLVDPVLRRHGHDVVAPDLPCDDDTATLLDYAETVAEAIGERRNLIVVGQSYGGFTAPLVADRLPVDVVVFVAGMVPAPGEKPADWWENTGYRQAVAAVATELRALHRALVDASNFRPAISTSSAAKPSISWWSTRIDNLR